MLAGILYCIGGLLIMREPAAGALVISGCADSDNRGSHYSSFGRKPPTFDHGYLMRHAGVRRIGGPKHWMTQSSKQP